MEPQVIKDALKEDIGSSDITSRLLIPKGKKIKAVLLLKEKGVVAGLPVAREVFKTAKNALVFKARCADGFRQHAGKILATVEGDCRAILKAERTALNLLSHLCGIATLTRAYVEKVKPYKVKILDTRKTIPGLRQLQKYAVRIGGGYNHRMGLYDGILIKDNHIAASCVPPLKRWRAGVRRASCVRELIEIAKGKKPENMKIEIEVKDLREFKEALDAEPDIIMLDNMKIDDIKKAVAIRRNTQYALRTTLLEVSGGVTLDNVRDIAKTGVDSISIGSLTHSVKAIDISLEVVH